MILTRVSHPLSDTLADVAEDKSNPNSRLLRSVFLDLELRQLCYVTRLDDYIL